MKKNIQIKLVKNVDVDYLKRWKMSSTKAKLQWLESALRFGKLRKF